MLRISLQHQCQRRVCAFRVTHVVGALHDASFTCSPTAMARAGRVAHPRRPPCWNSYSQSPDGQLRRWIAFLFLILLLAARPTLVVPGRGKYTSAGGAARHGVGGTRPLPNGLVAGTRILNRVSRAVSGGGWRDGDGKGPPAKTVGSDGGLVRGEGTVDVEKFCEDPYAWVSI